LRNCDCGPSNFDFRNSATIRSLLPILLLLVPFTQLRMVLKSIKNSFRTVCFSGNKKLALKGQLHEIFCLRFFFHEPRLDFMAKNMPKIVEMKLSSCGLEVADIRKIAIAELRLWSNISLKSCGIAIAEVFPSSCGIAVADSKESCACPPLLERAYVVQVCVYEK
jgi:hypothetical protein